MVDRVDNFGEPIAKAVFGIALAGAGGGLGGVVVGATCTAARATYALSE